MLGPAPAPLRVHLECGAESRPADAVAVHGQWVAVRGDRAVSRREPVRVHLLWDGGTVTTLPGTVRTSAPVGDRAHLTHVDVLGVEGDWEAFLRYLGARLATPAAA